MSNDVQQAAPASTAARLQEGSRRLMQYGAVAAGGLGLTNGKARWGPLHVQMGISDPCNHKCVMCWDHAPEGRENESTLPMARFAQADPGMMKFELFKTVIDDLHELGTRRIEMVGRGEPLLNKSIIDMIAYARALDFEVNMISNGSLLTEDRARRIVEEGLGSIKISLNAGTPETYPTIHVTETPENYLKVKRNLRFLADCKEEAGATLPVIQLSYCIGARNYHEIDQMVEVGHEVGAQEIYFSHTVVHEDSQDLMLNAEQLSDLKASIPAAQEKAKKYGIRHNLDSFQHAVPPYAEQEAVVGPQVVPCYSGWYFTMILGNGSVLFCTQCSEGIQRVTEERRFIDIWKSHRYQMMRKAARALPEENSLLAGCECDQCAQRPRNIAIHNFLHPLKQIKCGDEVRNYSVIDIARKWKGDYS